MQILNLDALRPEDKEITIDGHVYRIPGEARVSSMLEIIKAQQELEKGEIDGTENLTRSIWLMFKIRQPDLTFEEFSGLISINDCTRIAQFLSSAGESKNGDTATGS